MVSKITGVGSPPQGLPTLNPQLPPAACSKDSLASMGLSLSKSIGKQVFFAFVYVIVQSFSFLTNRREDLTKPAVLNAAFVKDPLRIINRILDLLDTNPALVKKILTNLANDWKENPENYLRYQPREKGNRLQWIGIFDEVIKWCILTNEERAFREAQYENTLDEEEWAALHASESDWGKRTNKTPEQVRVRALKQSIKNVEKRFDQDIWNLVKTLLSLQNPSFCNSLDNETSNPSANHAQSVGLLFERLMCDCGIESLRNLGVYEKLTTNTINFFTSFSQAQWGGSEHSFHVLIALIKKLLKIRDHSFIELKSPIEKLLKILEKQGKREDLWHILTDLIDIYYPSGKGS